GSRARAPPGQASKAACPAADLRPAPQHSASEGRRSMRHTEAHEHEEKTKSPRHTSKRRGAISRRFQARQAAAAKVLRRAQTDFGGAVTFASGARAALRGVCIFSGRAKGGLFRLLEMFRACKTGFAAL